MPLDAGEETVATRPDDGLGGRTTVEVMDVILPVRENNIGPVEVKQFYSLLAAFRTNKKGAVAEVETFDVNAQDGARGVCPELFYFR